MKGQMGKGTTLRHKRQRYYTCAKEKRKSEERGKKKDDKE